MRTTDTRTTGSEEDQQRRMDVVSDHELAVQMEDDGTIWEKIVGHIKSAPSDQNAACWIAIRKRRAARED